MRLNPECLLHPPLPIVLFGSHTLGSVPVYVVVILVDMDSNTIVVIKSPDSLLVLTNACLECSLGLTHVYLFAVTARDLIDHHCLLVVRHSVLHLHQCLTYRSNWFEDHLYSLRLN